MRFKIEAEELSNVLNAASAYQEEAVLNLKEKGILVRVHDKSQTAVYNSLIPASALGEYEIGEHPRIGIYVDRMNDIIPTTSDDVLVELEDYKININFGGRDYKLGNIDPDQVSGTPEMVPALDLPINITLDPNKITDAIDEVANHVYGGEGGDYFIQAQEGVLIIWGKQDDFEFTEHFHWEDFEDYDIDWQAATPSDSMPGNPSETKKMINIFSVDLTKDMTFFSDTARLEMGHGMPIKMVSESDTGIKHSWIVPPRFPKQGQVSEIPQRVIKERSVVA